MSDALPLVATPSQTVGPFFHIGLERGSQKRLAGPLAGEEIRLLFVVTDGDGRPVADAAIELWHVSGGSPVSAFGRLPTGEDGSCEFSTVRPPGAADQQSAAHINVCVFARGLLRHLNTRLYFDGDPALDADPVLALVPKARRSTLLAVADREQPGLWRFHVRLQGTDETVFFDA
jgi:protocatechuate 3,4-dioxygenase, alpha subunit